ncbi:MAG TPA: cytochrome c oxidase subunit II, partial [Phycisphaeraceae bacterium]
MIRQLIHSVPMALWDFPLFPPAASNFAETVDAYYFSIVTFAAFFTLLICFLILFFAAKYHHGRFANRLNPIQQTLRYEVTWVTIPALIALGLFGWSAKGYYDYARPPQDARTIYIVGKQWMWKAQHAEGPREINELHVPVGEPIMLVMTSQDVIHSFFVPAFRIKRDVLPDRYTRLWFVATQPGRYHLFCAEYCGADHSMMIGQVVAMSPGDFADWLSAGAPPGEGPVPGTPGTADAPLAVRGAGAFFRLGCNACHVPDAAVRAPRLDGLWGRPSLMRNGETVTVDERYIRESILNPNARIVAGYPAPSLMPTYQGQVSEEELQQLV